MMRFQSGLILLTFVLFALGGMPNVTRAASCSLGTADLTLGSVGPPVSCLQQSLLAEGFAIPALSGGAPYGYFGRETQAALAAWQAAHQVSPAAGYFGPLTRAAWAASATSLVDCAPGDLYSRTTGLLCAAPAPAPVCTTSPPGVGLGFTLSDTTLLPGATGTCNPPNSLADPSTNIALHYDTPAVRAGAQQELQAMYVEGARSVRDIIWFNIPTPTSAEGGPRVVDAPGGKLPDQVVSNILTFAEDAKAAGYERLVLVMGVQRQASPKCKKTTYGDCFDPALEPQAWSVAAQTITALRTSALVGMDIVFDIAPEQCFSPDTTANAANLKDYATYMIDHYVQTFGDDHHWIMSCATGQTDTSNAIASNLDKVQQTVSFWQALGAEPAYIDMHIYWTDASAIDQLLVGADAAASAAHLPLIIGETYTNDEPLFTEVATLGAGAQIPALQGIMVWPLTIRGTSCIAPAAPPYDISGINQALGRSADASGEAIKTCTQ